jgi:glycosyltransferase involved in cell wall biosynthesis
MTLGGTLIVRNGIEFDYCTKAAVTSLLGVCDKVVVVDGQSTDGTYEMLRVMASIDKRLTVLQREWKPCSMGTWLADLTNEARKALNTDMHINVQADEVLFEQDYPLIRKLASTGKIYTVERLNFWHDHRHLLPPDEKVGSTIVRLAPQSLPCVGDAQGLAHEQGWERSQIRLAHYGFIRDPYKLAAKSRPMQQAFFNTTDPVWEDVDKRGKVALIDPANPTCVAIDKLHHYAGSHPKAAHSWLLNHFYKI